MAGNGCCMRNVGSRDCPLSMTWKRSSMRNMYNHSHHSQVHGALNLQRKSKKSRRVSEETLTGFVSINFAIPSFNQLEIYGQNPATLQMCICTYHYDLSVITVPFITHWPMIYIVFLKHHKSGFGFSPSNILVVTMSPFFDIGCLLHLRELEIQGVNSLAVRSSVKT